MPNLNLPKTYTKEMWQRGGAIPAHKPMIGKPQISWSQIETFNSNKGFNTGLLGKLEYMKKYFLGERFPDMGWGTFGHEVEDCITIGECVDTFTPEEIELMGGIEPLGVFQEEVLVDFGDFVVYGFLDDRTPETEDGVIEILRDYKTKSKSSKKDLHKADKLQFEYYILGLQQRGFTVENVEYVIIERLGGRECMNGGGRESLSVGTNVWVEPYAFNQKTLDKAKKVAEKTAKEISDLYTIFQELNEV